MPLVICTSDLLCPEWVWWASHWRWCGCMQMCCCEEAFWKSQIWTYFLHCFSQEYSRDLVFPCGETCLVMQCPVDVDCQGERAQVANDFPSSFTGSRLGSVSFPDNRNALPPSFSRNLKRGDTVAPKSFLSLFICLCPSVVSLFCPMKWSPSKGIAVHIKQC